MEVGFEPSDVRVSYERGGREINDQARPVREKDGRILYHLDMSDRDVLVPRDKAQDPVEASTYIENELESVDEFNLEGIEEL